MSNNSFKSKLLNFKPYNHEFFSWAGDKSLREIWETCPNPEHLFWFAGRVVDKKVIVLAACNCAKLFIIPSKGKNIAKEAIESAELWAKGKIDTKSINQIAANAYNNGHYEAAAACYAAGIKEAISAAGYGADVVCSGKMREKCCNVIRDIISFELISAILGN